VIVIILAEESFLSLICIR